MNDEDLLFNFVYAKNKVYHENRKNVLKSIPELGFFNPVFIVLKYFFKIQEINPNHPLLFPKFKSSKGRKILINESLEPWTYDSCAKAYKKVFQELELDVDLSSISGTHSARIGSASEAVKDSSISLFDLKRASRWQGDKAPGEYLRFNEESLKKVPKILAAAIVKENKKQTLKHEVDLAILEAIN